MFRKIVIELDGPICSCEEESLGWEPVRIGDQHGLKISCKLCGTVLLIPHKKFRASFSLKREYPGKQPEKPKMECLDGGLEGKVIPLAPPAGDPKPA